MNSPGTRNCLYSSEPAAKMPEYVWWYDLAEETMP